MYCDSGKKLWNIRSSELSPRNIGRSWEIWRHDGGTTICVSKSEPCRYLHSCFAVRKPRPSCSDGLIRTDPARYRPIYLLTPRGKVERLLASPLWMIDSARIFFADETNARPKAPPEHGSVRRKSIWNSRRERPNTFPGISDVPCRRRYGTTCTK